MAHEHADDRRGQLPRLLHTPASDVAPTKPVWRWEGWIEAHSLHIGAGRQGGGKSTVVAWMVANLTTGGLSLGGTPIRCAWLSLEEPAERIVARLEAAGADMAKVDILGDVEAFTDDGESYLRRWRLPEDCSTMERKITELGTQLVVIDGFGYSVAGKQDYQEIGAALSALAGVCQRLQVAVLGLTHTAKGSSDAATAAIGSTAWTAIPRIVWVLGTDPADERRRVLQVSPSTNYRPPEHGMSFTIANYEPYECGYVVDIGESDVPAAELVAWSSPEERRDRDDARTWLRIRLGTERHNSKDVKADWKKENGSERTLQQARDDLGVVPVMEGSGGSLVSWWQLPDSGLPGSPERPVGAAAGKPENTAIDQVLFAGTGSAPPGGLPEGSPGKPGTPEGPPRRVRSRRREAGLLARDHQHHPTDHQGKRRMDEARAAAGVPPDPEQPTQEKDP
jgi:AAA domain